jgi:ABC-2 type transport system permease protein
VNFAIEVKELHKTFVSGWFTKRRKEALRGVNLSLPEGVFWGLLGPNGAGKTTLLSIIANLLIPEQGEVRVLGKDLRKNAGAVRRRINLSSGHANFLWSLTVRENLEYYAMLYDVWSKAIKHGFAAPVGIRHLLFGSLIVGILRGGSVFVILVIASYALFGFNFTLPGALPIALFVLGLFLSAAMVGVFVCILVLVFGNRAEVAAWSLTSLMLLLCGVYYPVSVLPVWVRGLAEIIPLTYFLEYFRLFYGFPPLFSHVLLKGYVMVIAYLVIEIFAMKAALRRAKRTGLLLKLSE